jgi:signal transduction histidine kinase
VKTTGGVAVLGVASALAARVRALGRRPVRLRISWLVAATLTALLALALEFAHPVASNAPALRATAEAAMTLLALVLIFAAAIRRERRIRSTIAHAATMSERRRVAQDLHDSLAQDLALIAAHEARITEHLGAEHPVVIAARRALAVSRGTISELSDTTSSSVHEALEAVADELGNRFGVDVGVDVRLDRELPPEARNQLARIAREAIANGARHGGARHVGVTLRQTAVGISLRVRDDGCGMHDRSGVPRREGFGLRSMRGRAAALGGSFAVRPRDGGGTEVEVLLPR